MTAAEHARQVADVRASLALSPKRSDRQFEAHPRTRPEARTPDNFAERAPTLPVPTPRYPGAIVAMAVVHAALHPVVSA
jgi:hypothetical protein